MKQVIWALFDDGNKSYSKALSDEFEVISIGIGKAADKNIDLRLSNHTLFKELDKLPKPDFIIASPPCESWTLADTAGHMRNGLWNIKNKQYYTDLNQRVRGGNSKRNFWQKENGRIIGEATCGATIAIIERYAPKHWWIENPATSRIWEFIEKHLCFNGVPHKFYYSTFNEAFPAKPTIFLCDRLLWGANLTKTKSQHTIENVGKYNDRSAIPAELIKHIIDCYKGEQDEKNAREL